MLTCDLHHGLNELLTNAQAAKFLANIQPTNTTHASLDRIRIAAQPANPNQLSLYSGCEEGLARLIESITR